MLPCSRWWSGRCRPGRGTRVERRLAVAAVSRLLPRWAASLSRDRSSVCPEEIDQEDAQAGDEAEGSAHDAHHEQGMSLQQANEPVGGLGGCVRRHVGAPVPIALRSACRAPMGGDGWTGIARDAPCAPGTTRPGRPSPPCPAPPTTLPPARGLPPRVSRPPAVRGRPTPRRDLVSLGGAAQRTYPPPA